MATKREHLHQTIDENTKKIAQRTVFRKQSFIAFTLFILTAFPACSENQIISEPAGPQTAESSLLNEVVDEHAEQGETIKSVKVSPFTTLFIQGPIHVQIDGSHTSEVIEIVGESAVINRVRVTQRLGQTLSLELPLKNRGVLMGKTPSIRITSAALRLINYQGAGIITFAKWRNPLKLVVTGQGELLVKQLNSPWVNFVGEVNSRTKLEGIIGTLNVQIRDRAHLDASFVHAQRSFITSQDCAQVISAPSKWLLGIQAYAYSGVGYSHDSPVTGLFVYDNARILRKMPKNLSLVSKS
jgi:hypothetical protein